MPDGLSDTQIKTQDRVDKMIFRLLSDLAGVPLDWDTEMIADVRDTIARVFEERSIRTEQDFFARLDQMMGINSEK